MDGRRPLCGHLIGATDLKRTLRVCVLFFFCIAKRNFCLRVSFSNNTQSHWVTRGAFRFSHSFRAVSRINSPDNGDYTTSINLVHRMHCVCFRFVRVEGGGDNGRLQKIFKTLHFLVFLFLEI